MADGSVAKPKLSWWRRRPGKTFWLAVLLWAALSVGWWTFSVSPWNRQHWSLDEDGKGSRAVVEAHADWTWACPGKYGDRLCPPSQAIRTALESWVFSWFFFPFYFLFVVSAGGHGALAVAGLLALSLLMSPLIQIPAVYVLLRLGIGVWRRTRNRWPFGRKPATNR